MVNSQLKSVFIIYVGSGRIASVKIFLKFYVIILYDVENVKTYGSYLNSYK